MNINDVPMLVFSVMMIGIFASMALLFVSQIGNVTVSIAGADSAAVNATNATVTALSAIPTWLPLIIAAAMITVAIAFLFMVYGAMSGGGGYYK